MNLNNQVRDKVSDKTSKHVADPVWDQILDQVTTNILDRVSTEWNKIDNIKCIETRSNVWSKLVEYW
jgi:hypothetical protein